MFLVFSLKVYFKLCERVKDCKICNGKRLLDRKETYLILDHEILF